MEDVWKEISLPPLHNPTTTTKASVSAANPSAFNGGGIVNFEAFLNKDPPQPFTRRLLIGRHSNYNHHSSSTTGGEDSSGFLFNSRSSSPPATVLSLKSTGHDLHHSLPSSKSNHHAVVSSLGNKRPASNDGEDYDRRRLRLIKNRESADRSRSRRQAHRNELELEVAELKRENQKLRRKLQEVRGSETSAPAKNKHYSINKHSLKRTLTAPF